jgi:hypothetical protein
MRRTHSAGTRRDSDISEKANSGKNSRNSGNDYAKTLNGTDEFDDANLLNKSSKDKEKSIMNL